jgi:hydrogenase maturation protease
MGDDGAGIRAVEILASTKLPSNVRVQEAGTPGWGLASWLEGWHSVILVDAVQMGQAPGSWRRFHPEEVQLLMDNQALSLHQADLACGLALAQELDMLPKSLLVYGIQPANTSPGEGLSPEIEANLPEMVARIIEEAYLQSNGP